MSNIETDCFFVICASVIRGLVIWKWAFLIDDHFVLCCTSPNDLSGLVAQQQTNHLTWTWSPVAVNPHLSPAFFRVPVNTDRRREPTRSSKLTQCLGLLQEASPIPTDSQYSTSARQHRAHGDLGHSRRTPGPEPQRSVACRSAELQGLYQRPLSIAASFPLLQLAQAFFQFVWFRFGVAPRLVETSCFLKLWFHFQGLVFLGFVSCC